MAKASDKPKEILAAAELLFTKKGYEATTIQDIMAAAEVSKGGFYHYFSSKEAVLDMICLSHAEYSSIGAEQRLISVSEPVERLNIVVSSAVPLRKDEAGFFGIMFPLINSPQGRAMRAVYEDMVTTAFLPILRREISFARDAEVIFPQMDSPETLVLQLMNGCWRELAESLRYTAEIGSKPDNSQLMAMLERYRRGIEVLLDAPFGTIEIISLEELLKTSQQLMAMI